MSKLVITLKAHPLIMIEMRKPSEMYPPTTGESRIRYNLCQLDQPLLNQLGEHLDEYLLVEIYRLLHQEQMQMILPLIRNWIGFPCCICHQYTTDMVPYQCCPHHICKPCALSYGEVVRRELTRINPGRKHSWRNLDPDRFSGPLYCKICKANMTEMVAWYVNLSNYTNPKWFH